MPAFPDGFFFFFHQGQLPTQGIHSHLLEILCRPTICQSLSRNMHCSVNLLIYLLSLKPQCLPFLFLMAFVLPQPFLTELLKEIPTPSYFLYLPIICREEQRIFLLTEAMSKYCNSCHAKPCRAHLSLATARTCTKKAVAGIFIAAQSTGTQNSKWLCEKLPEPRVPQLCSSSPSHILSSLTPDAL